MSSDREAPTPRLSTAQWPVHEARAAHLAMRLQSSAAREPDLHRARVLISYADAAVAFQRAFSRWSTSTVSSAQKLAESSRFEGLRKLCFSADGEGISLEDPA